MATLVTIASYHSQPKAEAARILLAQEGIEAVLLNETIVAMDWLLMNAIGGIKLQVEMQVAERASKIIGDLEADQKERLRLQATEYVRFKCSECEAQQQFTGDRRGGVETCSKCGSYVDVPELSDDQMVEQHLTVDATPDAPAVSGRRIPLPLEVICVLAFAYLPSLLDALPFWNSHLQLDTGLKDQMFRLIANSLQIVPPLLFVMAVSNEPWSKFGIVRPRWLADPAMAVGVWLISTFMLSLTLVTFQPTYDSGYVDSRFDKETPFATQSETIDTAQIEVETSGTATTIGWGMLVLCLFALIANSIAEELAMRGYLIPRFEELFRSPVAAIGLSSAIFASYHIYQEPRSVIGIFLLAIVYGVFFCIVRRLWPLVIAHTATNLMVYLNI